MPLNVGDAVLTFLGDTSQLDQVFARVPEQADAAMSAAAVSVDQFGDALKGVEYELDYTAANAAFAGGEIKETMGAAGASAAQLEEKIRLVKERMAELAYQASIAGQATAILRQGFGELGDVLVAALGIEAFKSQIEGVQKSILALELLSEKTGIAITTMAGIEHVSQAAGVGFEQVSTALTRLSRAQILAIEGGQQQVTAFRRIGISTSELKSLAPEELFYRVGEALANSSSHGAAAASAFALLGRGGAALIPIFQQSQQELRGMVDEAAKSSGVTKDAANSAREWEAQTTNLSEAWRSVLIPLMKGAVPVIRAVETAASSVAMIIRDLASALGGIGLVFIDQAKAMGTIFDDVIHGNFAKLESDGKQLAETMTHDLLGIGVQFKQEWANTADYIKHVWSDVKPLKPIKDDFSDLAANQKDLVKVAKSALDEQLANIDAWKAKQHAAYATGATDAATWAVAELHATDAAAIAHEDYLRKIIEIYAKAGEIEKARAATQELAALRTKNEAEATEKAALAMQKQAQNMRKLREEYDQLIATNVAKEWEKTQKAAEALTHAEEELSKAQSKLAETKVADHYRDQESAIRNLAQMRLITEQQMNDRLALLEKKQADEAIAILEKQLKKQQDDVAAAQAKLASQKNSPFVSQAQILEAEANLKKLQAAVVVTETQIVQVEEKYNKQSEAETKGHYGRALQLATAYGRDLLAEQLKQNHAELVAAQDELKLAKARGIDTTAIKHKIAALKDHEQVLEKEASGNKKVIDAQLQVTKVQILAAQSVLNDAKARGMDTTAIEKQITDLKKLEVELQKTKQGSQNVSRGMVEMRSSVQDAAQTMTHSFATATAAMISGQESFGKAMEKATLQMLSQLAQHWADYYLALAIGNIWTDPAAAAEEFAAAAALEVIAGAMSGLGSSSSSGAGGGGSVPGQNQAGLNPQQAGSAGGGGQQTQGVTRLATGGIVSSPTMFMAGDSPSGGAADEAILPLSDPEAMRKVAQSIIGSIIPISQDRGKEAAMVSTASAVSNIPGYDFGVPSVRERPDFNFSSTPIPRETPDVQAMAARFGGLLSVPTLRAATAASNQAARASAETASSSGSFDNASLEKFADRVGSHVAASQGPTTRKDSGASDSHVHVNVKGMISPDNLNKVIRKISRQVQNRQATLNASNSLRLTRRSQ
jgi:hypothetical protein